MTDAEKQVQQANLDDEEKILNELQKVYQKALDDCTAKITELNSNSELQDLQSTIYQRQYQEMLEQELTTILDDLQTNSYSSIEQYLTNSYTNGYTGAMYSIADQGIPVITPIDQNQVVKALQTNSKLSTSLYNALGEDINYLKNSIRAELSRGIANGSSWLDMAQHIANGMNSPWARALANAMRIARTEGHRITQEAALDAMQEAVDHGADVVKQWDATLDNRTRPAHQEADGQIREMDEPFDVGGEQLDAPGVGGSAANVINCRCVMLQRARWALDEDELKELQDRADYFGLDKSDSFDEFKEKYLQAAIGMDTESATKLVFQEASSIKEAEEFARRCGVENVSYKGVDLRVANAMNQSLVDAFNYCSDLKNQIKWYGSLQEINKALKADLIDCFVKEGYSQSSASKAASRLVGKTSSTTMATARSGTCYGGTSAEQEVIAKYKGIGVNANIGKNYDTMLSDVQWDVQTKFHPEGCDTIKSVFDHEFGHQLDYEYGLRNNTTIQQAYYSSDKVADIKYGLSEYGAKNVAEFIAESYSEYVNNPNYRKYAKLVGEIIDEQVKGQ